VTRTVAMISVGKVVDVIVVDDLGTFQEQSPGYFAQFEVAVDVTDLQPTPGPGWSYAGGQFAPPAGSPPTVKFHVSTTLIPGEKIVAGLDWADLGVVVTNAGFFSVNAAGLFGRINASVLCVGAGAELRVVERALGGAERAISAVKPVADSAGAWVLLQFSTNQPPSPSECEFVLQGRLGGAVSLLIRGCSMSLLELVF